MGEPQPAADASGAQGHPPGAPPEAATLLSSSPGPQWLGREHRRQDRFQVQASRPIAIRAIGADQDPGPWLLADILDISLGGVCLMISEPIPLQLGQSLQLDLRAHPDFQAVQPAAQVRWTHSAHGFTTLGIAFEPPLTRLPRLELERRSSRRDPNTSAPQDPSQSRK